MENAGQISMDIQTEWACVDNNQFGSFGAALGGTQNVLTIPTTGGDLELAERASGSNGVVRSIIDGTSVNTRTIKTWSLGSEVTSSTNPRLTTHGKGAYIRWSLGWKEDPDNTSNLLMMQAVDGVMYVYESVPKTSLTAMGANFWIGSNSAGGQVAADHYIKNLLVSNAAPEFTTGRKIMLFGDSMARWHDFGSEDNYDSLQGYRMLKALQDKGEYLDSRQIVIDRWPGYSVQTTGSIDLGPEVAGALARHNPTEVVYIASSNDAINNLNFNQVQYETDLDSQITALTQAPVTKFAMTNVRSLVFDTAIDNPTNTARRDLVNSLIAGRPENKVDSYSLLGLDSPDPYTYIGQANGADDDFPHCVKW